MSQHYFNTTYKGFPITVTLGWDRRMQYFFLFIEKPAGLIEGILQDEDDHILYSSLHEADPFGHELDYYQMVLSHYQIVVPENMFIEVQHDAERNVGNRFVKHQADGAFNALEL